jgi:outer membrane lipoprotein carrier protein
MASGAAVALSFAKRNYRRMRQSSVAALAQRRRRRRIIPDVFFLSLPSFSRIWPTVVLCAFATVAPRIGSASEPVLQGLLDGVERHYNRAQTLSIGFTETYQIAGKQRPPEMGNLLLKKPGRMRWTYSKPSGKLFVSDGKNVFLYTAADNRVERSTLKESEDMRAPMAFLLGKLDLKREFKSFETRPAPAGTWLVAQAGDKLPYEKVEMLIGQNFEIQSLSIDSRDQSVLTFQFRDEVVNPKVDASVFQFAVPRGADIVDAVGDGSGDN